AAQNYDACTMFFVHNHTSATATRDVSVRSSQLVISPQFADLNSPQWAHLRRIIAPVLALFALSKPPGREQESRKLVHALPGVAERWQLECRTTLRAFPEQSGRQRCLRRSHRTGQARPKR